MMGGIYAINLITLRDGVAVADFARFSSEVDQPTCLAQDVVLGFDAYAVERREPAAGRVDVVEMMHVRSWEEWVAVRDGLPAMERVVAGFETLVPPDGVQSVFGRRIDPRVA
jgi:hypothetical protein